MGKTVTRSSGRNEQPAVGADLTVLHDAMLEDAFVVGADGTISYTGDGLATRLGRASSELAGHQLRDLIHSGGRELFDRLWDRVTSSSATPARIRLQLEHRDGTHRLMHLRLVNLLGESAVRGVVVHAWEADELEVEPPVSVVAPEDPEQRLKRLRALADLLDQGVLVVDVQRKTRFVNAWLRQHVGPNLNAVLSKCHVEDRGAIERALNAPPDEEAGRIEARIDTLDGKQLWTVVSIKAIQADDGGPWGALVTIADITAERVRYETLARAALHDPLTGLPNRALLDDRLQHAITRHQRRPGLIAVLFCDIDGFKEINDNYGHTVGDDVLRHIAGRIGRAMREEDTVSRFGGDEFVVICEDVTDPDQPVVVAERILSAMAAPIQVGVEKINVAISIGIATMPPVEPAGLLTAADAAMYRAKRSGGRRYETSQ